VANKQRRTSRIQAPAGFAAENSVNKETSTKAPCNDCNRDTKHRVLFKRITSGSDDDSGFDWRDTYEMLECCGCESVAMRWTNEFSENPEPTVTYYPPPVARQTPKWVWGLPTEVRSLMDEIYSALHANSRRLALMGARTVVDMLLMDKVGDVGTFPDKLAQLESDGFVGLKNRAFLGAALEAGNAAAHRGYQPKKEHLDHVMDIVENLLQAVYILEEAADELKKSTPARKFKGPRGR
jgi:hypothetical protein